MQKTTIKKASERLGVKPKTLRGYLKDSKSAPKVERIGKTEYLLEDDFIEWIGEIAGKKISSDEVFLKSADVMKLYDKSYTWLWYVVKRGEVAKPFTLNRTNFWLGSELGVKEL